MDYETRVADFKEVAQGCSVEVTGALSDHRSELLFRGSLTELLSLVFMAALSLSRGLGSTVLDEEL